MLCSLPLKQHYVPVMWICHWSALCNVFWMAPTSFLMRGNGFEATSSSQNGTNPTCIMFLTYLNELYEIHKYINLCYKVHFTLVNFIIATGGYLVSPWIMLKTYKETCIQKTVVGYHERLTAYTNQLLQ